MARSYYIFLFLMIGSLLSPNASYGISPGAVPAERHCTPDQASSAMENCCARDASDQNSSPCEGDCPMDSCQFPSGSPDLLTACSTSDFTRLAGPEHHDFHYQETLYSNCFLRIWQPPKIG